MIFNEYIPELKLLRSCIESPLFQKYVYGAFPPVTVMSILPSFPKQVDTLFDEYVILIGFGWLIRIESEITHPLSFVIMTE